jgi:hypothetical protein
MNWFYNSALLMQMAFIAGQHSRRLAWWVEVLCSADDFVSAQHASLGAKHMIVIEHNIIQ